MAIGSGLMVNTLQGYAFLKVAGKGKGLDEMRKMLSARFTRSRAGDERADACGGAGDGVSSDC